MRSPAVVAAFSLLLLPSAAHAADPDPALVLFSGASIQLLGFVVGGALLGTSGGDAAQNNVGWLTIESGFGLAPLAAHGVMNEWVRGTAFAAAPAGVVAATAGIFAADGAAVRTGGLPEQRWMWGLFGVGLATSALGVVDALWAPARLPAVRVVPTVGKDQIGLRIAGTL